MEFGELSTNPFSGDIAPQRAKRNAFVSALKLLLLVAVCLGVTVILGSHSRTWLTQHLTSDFDSLDSETKRTRLTQVSVLGVPAIEPLVSALADRDVQVARTAFELLQDVQERWGELDEDQRRQRQLSLVDAMQTVAVQIPDDRTGWGTSLLQPTIAATVHRRDDSSKRLYQRTIQLIDLLAISERAGPSVLSDQPLEPTEPRRITIRPKSLPVSLIRQDALVANRSDSNATSTDQSDRVARSTKSVTPSGAATPSVYRSGGGPKLRPTTDSKVILTDIGDRRETSYQANPLAPVAHVVNSPMETLDDESVMQWLGSPHSTMRAQAEAELLNRGYSRSDISIASRITAGDVPARLAMIDAISRSDQTDPRPWLFMALNDESRQVKLRTIAILATMQDAYVDQRLRMKLTEERDTTVIAKIRQVLELK